MASSQTGSNNVAAGDWISSSSGGEWMTSTGDGRFDLDVVIIVVGGTTTDAVLPEAEACC